jgi:hypothetical protein
MGVTVGAATTITQQTYAPLTIFGMRNLIAP